MPKILECGKIARSTSHSRYAIARVGKTTASADVGSEAQLSRVAMVSPNLNTGDTTCNDPTIRRCFGIFKRSEDELVESVNLFAYCASCVEALSLTACDLDYSAIKRIIVK